ncbi:class I adenylate-forming enzyme family protein [Mangrovitalea sediminis]|uniref:class I adenylate-forming enzyme family protein n=1 Tax=Mangrovitalea sediminis TaxID=1982043 RepID=UPI000BE56F2C|nr:AMP-binding protein [Mangrovitalea sediminis]
MNIATLLPQAALRWTNLTALQSSSGQRLTFGQFHDRVRRLAYWFEKGIQLRPGDRVVLFMENRMEYPEIMFATWYAGLVVVPVNAKLHAREFSHILRSSEASIAFISNKNADAIVTAGSDTPCTFINVDEGAYQACFGDGKASLVERDPNDLAWLFYTSGTTGKPKGAMQSHRNLYAMLNGFLDKVKKVEPGQALYHGAPMSHGSGYYTLPFMANGGCQIIPASGGFDVEELCQILSEHPSVSFFAAPTMVKRILDRPDLLTKSVLSGLDRIIYGGGPMYLRDLERAHDVFGHKLVQIYGQGECPMTITVLDEAQHKDTGHPRYRTRLSSVGQAQSGIEIKIVDPVGNVLPAGETGEILVRGDAVMLGYWNNAEASAATIKEGWLHTGDVGHLDEDNFLYLTDRSKDVIISGGTNVYPREVEEVLLQHPDVKEVSVIGAADADWGERVVACIATQEGKHCSPEELGRFCATQLARFKLPKEYRFYSELPKNATGKILKTTLRDQVGEIGTGSHH